MAFATLLQPPFSVGFSQELSFVVPTDNDRFVPLPVLGEVDLRAVCPVPLFG